MLHIIRSILLALPMLISHASAQSSGKHLFILSGQSNMARLDPALSFTPTLQKALGAENIIVVKSAYGGQPIRRWYREWQQPGGQAFANNADLYDSLMEKLVPAIDGQQLASVTFIWMQGERDARESVGTVYEKSLLGLYEQLSNDLARKDLRFVIGRLSDFGINNADYKHWNMIREIEMRVGDSDPKFAWINTDDLNDGYDNNGKPISNDLHMSVEGYRIMGERFAAAALRLLNH